MKIWRINLIHGNFVQNNIKSAVPNGNNKEPKTAISSSNKTETIKKSETVVDNNSGNSEIDWAKIIGLLKSSGKVRLFTSLANTKINQQGDMILEIIFPNGLTPFVKSILEDSSNKKDLSDILFSETGKQWHIKLVDEKNSGNVVSKPKIENSLGIDINIIE